MYEQETNTLHWVDIGKNQVHHLQLHTHAHTFDTYEHPVSCIRLRTDGPGVSSLSFRAMHKLTLPCSLSPHASKASPSSLPPRL